MELTLFNIILIVALVAISILFGVKIGYDKGKIAGLALGCEETREYFFSKIPKKVADKILEEEQKKFIEFLFSDEIQEDEE